MNMIGSSMISNGDPRASRVEKETVTRPIPNVYGQGNPRRKLNSLKRLLPLIALLTLGGIVLWQGWLDYLTFEQLATNQVVLEKLIAGHLVPALGVYMLIYIAVVALSLPGGSLLTIAGGLLFGWLLAGVATVVAATAGAVIIFLVARSSLGEPLAARAGPWLDKFSKGFQENALSYLLFLRLVPAFPFWVVNLAPAFLGVRLRDYIIGTAVGIIPGTFAYAIAGAGLDSVLDAQRLAYERCLAEKGAESGTCAFQFEPSALITTELLIAFAVLGVIALIPVLLKKLRRPHSEGA